MWKFLYSLAMISLMVFLCGCANIVPPSGGPQDFTPPKMVSISPADSLLNTRPSHVEILFDKYMEIKDLGKNMEVSPSLRLDPTVTALGKKVVIKIADSLLQPNTTYRIFLGNALTDNRESTPYKDFSYSFSTGPYFDSLQVSGRIFNAETGYPDTSGVAVLYADSVRDSFLSNTKPLYTARADINGRFTIPYLPARLFKMVVFSDRNSDRRPDFMAEPIGFPDSAVTPVIKDRKYEYQLYTSVMPSTDSAKKDSAGIKSAGGKGVMGRGGAVPATVLSMIVTPDYDLNTDTLNHEKRTQDITKPLALHFRKKVAETDTGRIRLSYEYNGVDVEAVAVFEADSHQIIIRPNWLPDRVYTLRLMTGFAKDTAGKTLEPGRYTFRTKSDDDYSRLTVHIPSRYYGTGYVFHLLLDTATIYMKPVTDSTIMIQKLTPGKYTLSIIEDRNQNGKWDGGNFFARIQPERVIPNNVPVTLKEGWENEIDFAPADFSATKPQLRRPGAQPIIQK